MDFTTSPDGTTIAWASKGNGPPLLLVHGTTATHARWSGVSAEFEEHFTVHAMDRRGRGGSTDAPDYDILREAEDVVAVVEALGGQVSIVSHSYGAVCSLEASLLTDRIARMVLYEPPVPTGIPMYPPEVPDQMEALIDADEAESAVEVFFGEVVGMSGPELAEYRRLPMWEGRVALAPTIPRELAIDRNYAFKPDRFSELDVPVRLLLGGDSPPLFQMAVQTVEAALPNASVEVLAGQSHIAMDTNPDLFVAAVLGFLTS